MLAATVLAPPPAAAQSASLIGTVLADSTERPLAGAEVAFPTLGRSAHTDSAGNFRIDRLPAGTHALTIRLIGYGQITTALTFGLTERLERDFLLTPRPVKLATVEVDAPPPSRNGRLAEFELRKKVGIGHFLTQELFDRNTGEHFGDLLTQNMPGIRLSNIGVNRFAAASSRGQNSFLKAPSGDEFDRRVGARPDCYVQVIIDGIVRYRSAPDVKLFDINSVAPDQIAAVEYYSAAETPSQFNMTGSACGTLVIWLRS